MASLSARHGGGVKDSPPDPRLDEARVIPIEEIAVRLGLGQLRQISGELVGPCPACGGDDRFAINLTKGVFLCRRCAPEGGDGIKLVQHAIGCDFRAALAWLCGERDVQIDPAEQARRKARYEAAQKDQQDQAAQMRAKAIAHARRIWRQCVPAEGTLVRRYLEIRGIAPGLLPDLPRAMRFHPALPYWRKVAGEGREWHRGPAMVCAIQQPNGQARAVHMTWIDPDQPKGKAVILANGEPQPAKLMRGSAKSGAIRLSDAPDFTSLVIGEGIETTLTAAIKDRIPGAAYWSGASLGNIAGKMQRGKGMRYAGQPDLSDDTAFVPPSHVRRLYIIKDGDSDPKLTHAKCLSGARRAMALVPGLEAKIIDPGPGLDLNDRLLGQAPQEGAEHE